MAPVTTNMKTTMDDLKGKGQLIKYSSTICQARTEPISGIVASDLSFKMI